MTVVDRTRGLPDPWLDHSLPIAVAADDINACCDPRHVAADDEVTGSATRTLHRSLGAALVGLAGDAMMPMLFTLLSALSCFATHSADCAPEQRG